MSQLSYIHPEAKIGSNVTIEPFSTIYKDVEIGDGTWIGPNSTIMDGARIGKNCKIFPGAVMKSVQLIAAVLVIGWMTYATWSMEVARRNSARALAVASQTCGLVYRGIERKALAQGASPPAHPPVCNWVD